MSNGIAVSSTACLSVRGPDGMQQTVHLDGKVVTVGRSSDNTIALNDRKASRKRLEIRRGPDGRYVLHDLGSTNGTVLNGSKVREAPLAFGDVIGLGAYLLVFESSVADDGGPADIQSRTILPRADADKPGTDRETIGLAARSICVVRCASIGRARDSDLVLDHPQISRHHAHIRREGDGFVIVDLNSTNGVYVNGAQVSRAMLTENARVQIGPYRFAYAQGVLRLVHDHLRLDVVHVTQQARSCRASSCASSASPARVNPRFWMQ